MTGFSALAVAEDGGWQGDAQWAGTARIRGPPWARFPALTIGLLGVQVLWSVEMSYAPPYLLSLGLTKSLMALVFVAGPLSGLIVQPLIGVLADTSKSRFGRRRPYMILGAVICVGAVLLLGFTREFASIITVRDSLSNDLLTIWLAVISIYCIDFSINAVQAVDRALLVDTLPATDQALANAWAAQVLGVGSVLGFFFGNVDLPAYFSWLGNTQLKVLAVIASFLLLGTHAITAFSVQERVLVSASRGRPKGFINEMKMLWDNILTLPRVIRQICVIQFFSWIGWFPILFYLTTYIGELHARASPLPPPGDDAAQDALDAEGTRLGTRALFYSALLALATSLLAPHFVADADVRKRREERVRAAAGGPDGVNGNGGLYGNGWAVKKSAVADRVKVPLTALWAASHALFAICMAGTLFTSSVWGATVLMTATGFSWAVSMWVPFSLIGEAILTESPPATADDAGSIRLADARSRSSFAFAARRSEDERQFLVASDDESEHDDIPPPPRATSQPHHEREQSDSSSRESTPGRPAIAIRPSRSREGSARAHATPGAGAGLGISLMGNGAARQSRIDVDGAGAFGLPAHDEEAELEGEVDGTPDKPPAGDLSSKAGIILGIHNIFVVIPQFLVTALSSAVFALVDPDKSVLHGHHPGTSHRSRPTLANATAVAATATLELLVEQAQAAAAARDGPNSVAIIFRVGGVAALSPL